MNEAAPKPKRRRWPRAVAAAALLIVTAAAGWWYWPRGDARLVGKWVGRLPGVVFSRTDFEFCRNGRGRVEWGQFPFVFTLLFWWSVQEDELRLSTSDKPYVISRFVSPSELRLIDPDGREWTLLRETE